MPLVLGLLELVGYREWTEAIGEDREWRIQVGQARLYAAVQDVVTRYGGFVAPLSFDNMVLILNGVPREAYREAYEAAARYSPVSVALYIVETSSPRDLRPRGEPGLHVEASGQGGRVAVMHVDLNSFTRLRRSQGAVAVYLEVLEEYARLAEALQDHAVPAYLGGDNAAFFAASERLADAIEALQSAIDKTSYKVGVGEGWTAREALAAAARALHRIRSGAEKGWLAKA